MQVESPTLYFKQKLKSSCTPILEFIASEINLDNNWELFQMNIYLNEFHSKSVKVNSSN